MGDLVNFIDQRMRGQPNGTITAAEWIELSRAVLDSERLRAAIYKAGVMLSQGMSKMEVENYLRVAYTNDPNANLSR